MPIGFTAQHVKCPRGISRLHAPEVYSKSISLVDWGEIEVDTDGTFEEGPICMIVGIRFYDARP